MDGTQVKQEIIETLYNGNNSYPKTRTVSDVPVIDLDSSDDDSSSSGNRTNNRKRARVYSGGSGSGDHSNKMKKAADGVVLPAGFLDPLPPKHAALPHANGNSITAGQSNKQFWKAGDFEGGSGGDWDTPSGGLDHVRVHPRFLHSNATSHKWVLGAFAELLDNSLDEVCNGATYVNIDMRTNKKDGNRMLLIEDNGGGMDPDKIRQCMSLGYSLKSKVRDTIGQYGNGFKTSTMRLGADVIVFSRCTGKDGKRPTQSIGLLSYTFLRSTGKEDIVVPMLDYTRSAQEWKKMIRTSARDWDRNVEAMVQWSPFSSEEDLMKQFDHMKDQGTRIIIYNLWEDDQGQLELDFDADKHDIQIRGVNRDEKNIQMAQQYPNSRHFLTYRHSLRSYASILYLRVPPGFRMILRGKDVQHHNIVNDMMMTTEVTYRPQPGADGVTKDTNIVAVVTMGFVKDAKAHIDVQGFNVYHKNRLIKPFWRLWNVAGSDGRGVIGVLEANFVEPAHDKQGFERTIVLSRLETRLVQMQKTYWNTYCHKIGYAPRRNKKNLENRESSPDFTPEMPSRKKSSASNSKIPASHSDKFSLHEHMTQAETNSKLHTTSAVNGNMGEKGNISHKTFGKGASALESTSPSAENIDDDIIQTTFPIRHTNDSSQKGISAQKNLSKNGSLPVHSALHARHSEAELDCSPGANMQIVSRPQSKFSGVSRNGSAPSNGIVPSLDELMEENRELKDRLRRMEEEMLSDLPQDLEVERKRCKELEAQLEEANRKCEELTKDQDNLINEFNEERHHRDVVEETLRSKLKDATASIQGLVERVTQLELEKKNNFEPKWGQ